MGRKYHRYVGGKGQQGKAESGPVTVTHYVDGELGVTVTKLDPVVTTSKKLLKLMRKDRLRPNLPHYRIV